MEGQGHRPVYQQPSMAPQPHLRIPQDGNIAMYGIQDTQARPFQPAAPVIATVKELGPHATSYTCPSCLRKIVTKVEHKTTMMTHLIAMMVCRMGCLPCACIPYCDDTCKNAQHYCPSCDAYLGVYKN